MRKSLAMKKLLPIVEPRSATMKMGLHQGILSGAVDRGRSGALVQECGGELGYRVGCGGLCRSGVAVCDDIEQLLARCP